MKNEIDFVKILRSNHSTHEHHKKCATTTCLRLWTLSSRWARIWHGGNLRTPKGGTRSAWWVMSSVFSAMSSPMVICYNTVITSLTKQSLTRYISVSFQTRTKQKPVFINTTIFHLKPVIKNGFILIMYNYVHTKTTTQDHTRWARLTTLSRP